MHVADRVASIERWLDAIAFTVGRHVARGVSVLPRLVRRASGLEEPSVEATVAGVIRGVTALAPATLGGISGAALEHAGTGAALAIASFVVGEASPTRPGTLVEAVARAEALDLCSAREAAIWRAAVGLTRGDRHMAASAALDALRTLRPATIGLRVARDVLICHALRGLRGLRDQRGRMGVTGSLRGMAFGLGVGHAWIAMGEAARLVDGVRTPAPRPSATIIPSLPARPARAA